MYTSDMSNAKQPTVYRRSNSARQGRASSLGKAIMAYLAASVFTFVFARVYNLFGHGITSPFMSWMFLFPLLGGSLPLGLAATVCPQVMQRSGWRLGFNLHNAGIATLTVGSALCGIFEIAGTSSAYTMWFFVVGAGFVAAGLLAQVLCVDRKG